MKNFYEMLQILESLNEPPQSYFEPPDDPEVHYHDLLIGEDDDAFCTTTVSGTDMNWQIDGTLFINNYKLTGEEDPKSKPIQHENGVEFMNPGKHFENIPNDLADSCVKYIDQEVEDYIKNYDPKEKDYDDYDNSLKYH